MMPRNLSLFERCVRFFLALLFFLNTFFVEYPGVIFFFILIGLFLFGEAVFGRCLLLKRLGVSSVEHQFSPIVLLNIFISAVHILLAYIWLQSGIDKILAGGFLPNLDKVLSSFAAHNPLGFMQTFLLGAATDHSMLFGTFVEWGEVLVGLGLLCGLFFLLYGSGIHARRWAGIFSIAALVGGIFLNVTFYLAAGWISSAVAGLNIVLFYLQFILLYVWTYLMKEQYGREVKCDL